MWTSMQQSHLISSLYEAILENIKSAFLAIPKNKPVFHSILKNLQETLVSMNPLLLVQMDPTMEEKFRYLLETLNSQIPHLAKFKEKLHEFDASYMTKLEDSKYELKKFYTDYVLDQLKRTHEEGGVTDVYQLSRTLLKMIETRNSNASNSVKPILEKLRIILLSLICDEHGNTSELLISMLKGVKVSVQFLNGCHGIDIKKYLRDYEQVLRRFVNEKVQKQLEVEDRQIEVLQRKKTKEEYDIILFCAATVVAYLTYAPQSLISSIFFLAAVTVFVALFTSESLEKVEYRSSDTLNLIFAAIVAALFTCPTLTLIYVVIVIGALLAVLKLCKSENHELQRKKFEDQSEQHIKNGEFDTEVILFHAAVIVGTTVACFAYWQNTLFSGIFFIVGIVLLAIYFKSKILVPQRRNAEDKLEIVIVFFNVILVVSFVILFVSLFFKPTGKEDCNNEIFLSFRGADTRFIFACSLHNNLEKANIRTFYDERSMRKGKQIWGELQREIRNSVGAIIVVSQNYAESEDCLDELLQIQERARKYKDYILKPIFYDVRPNDLTDKQSKFYQALQKHVNAKKIKAWDKALETLCSYAGYTYTSNLEHMDRFIDRVVGDVKKYLRPENGHQIRKYI